MSTEMKDLSPEELAEYAHANNDLVFSPYESGSNEHERFVNELLRLTTKEGKKK